MYTATDIRNVDFTKVMGGYKIAEVEAFVEECAQTVETLAAEKEELGKKLGILADKLVEYRRDEDNIRSALLNAQRTGDTIIHEAEGTAAKIIADAEREAEGIVASAKGSISMYEGEIERLKKEVADFKNAILSMYKEHLTLIRQLPDAQAPAKAVPTPAPVAPEAPAEEKIVAPAPVAPVVPAQPEEVPTAPRSKFANLKFGEDYSLSDDADGDDDQE